MSLQFIIGRSGSGKTTYCLQQIKNFEEQRPQGQPVIYLVPEQMTFQSEYALLHTYQLKGMIRTQVFSMTRLALRVLQETGGIARYHLNKTGIHVLLRKIIESAKEELHLFKQASSQNGFIEQLEELITEWKRYVITPEALFQNITRLSQMEQRSPSEEVLLQKLLDLQLILQKYEQALENKYIDSEDYLALFTEQMEHSQYIKNADILIDGFHSFTPQELLVIEGLVTHARSVKICLTLDRPYDEEPPDMFSLFKMTGTTYYQLAQLVKEKGIKLEETINLNKEQPPRFLKEGLRHLERHFEARPFAPAPNADGLTLISAVNRRAEIEAIARKITNKVRDEQYRYRDFLLLMRNGEEYRHLIEKIFAEYQIPVFLDEKRSMLQHPLIELLRSSVEAIHSHWRYEPLFRAFKTGLFFPEMTEANWEKLYKLENYVLAYGIRGERWKQSEDWKVYRPRNIEEDSIVSSAKEQTAERELNELRRLLAEPLIVLEENLKHAQTLQEYCEAIFLFLEQLDIPKKLEKLRNEADEKGELIQAREHEQVWDAVIDLLDQMVELMGDEALDNTLFQRMFETGLDSLRFTLVPPALDQVLIGDMEHSRFIHVKCAFVIGVNDGVIPARPQENSLLTEQERELLQQSGIEMAPASLERILDENFIIYTALTSCSDELTVSYPIADDEGKALMPSILIRQLTDTFPTLPMEVAYDELQQSADELPLDYITAPEKTVSLLIQQLQQWKKGYSISDIWWDVYNYVLEHYAIKKVIDSLFYENRPENISTETSKHLYGEEINASVSRLEKYQSCSFSHFISYGLKLKEREVYKLKAPDIGELFHAALKKFGEYLLEHKLSWTDLDESKCKEISVQIVTELAPKIQREILSSTSRFQYMQKKFQQIVERVILVLREHAKVSGFTPVGLELGFGRKNDPIPPVVYTLENGRTMKLIGRIDRVDRAYGNEGPLLRIVDYKSSETNLGMTEVYVGLSLQILVYLDVVLTYANKWLNEEALPAGVLYFHVHNPIINKNKAPTLEAIEEELVKSFKMKGLVLADKEIVQLMDSSLEKGHSQVIPVGLKASGEFYSNSSIISKEQFEAIRKYIRTLIQKIGLEITNGSVAIDPYSLQGHTACAFCSFQSICQFDPSLEENEFRIIRKESSKEILQKVMTEGGI